MMFGFSKLRRALLVEELQRMASELPRLGVERAWLIGDLADSLVGPESQLEFVVIHKTAEPFHRRSDFFVTHLRPSVGTNFLVYTPDEFDQFSDSDQLLLRAIRGGEGLPDV